ncbi:MAG TPA: inner membrane CreD family protein [Candidatus Hydrogenedentes bacterium]|nr:inner membrane CreD family protein [Candidatus Hydrogenedentota bacterium]
MNTQRIIAITLIFLVACAAWMNLGNVTAKRSIDSSGRLGPHVEALWGAPLVQEGVSLTAEIPGNPKGRCVLPAKNIITVTLETDYRKKGLIWYPTYLCSFQGAYTITNLESVAQKFRIHFKFPCPGATYDEFSAVLDGKQLQETIDTSEGIAEILELSPGASADFQVAYKTRGIREWRYKPGTDAGRVQNLNLVVNTSFRAVDYPDGCLSPMSSQAAGDGMTLHWKAADLITKQDIGVIIPERLNPGPLTARITFFAPVCLIFFFVLVLTINILYKVNIHPMHYLFVAAGFFAFHLLLAYMAGLVHIHLAFIISAIVSVTLVTTYLSAALRGQFPWKIAAAGQIFFLVLFSYSFFLKGITGLTVAIGSVVTLAILMKVTAHVDWESVFANNTQRHKPIAPLPNPTPTHDAKLTNISAS